MTTAPTPAEQVLVQYANENLQLKLENARLAAELAEARQPRAASEGDAPSEE